MVGLTLHPVFLDLVEEASNGTRVPNVSADDLYSMWMVATKVKGSIPDGYRLENLSWRLWYSSSYKQMMKRKIEDQQPSRSPSTTTESDSSLPVPVARSQATSIPKPKSLFSPTSLAILAEIQQASLKPTTFFSVPNMSPMQQHPDQTMGSSESPSADVREGSEHLTRKKKKNVDKYIRRYQPHLEQIVEMTEEARIQEEKSKPLDEMSRPIGSQDFKIPVKSMPLEDNHSGSEASAEISNASSHAEFEDKRMDCSPISATAAQKQQKISLLTALLGRRLDSERPGSCPPPICISPPMRPSAPPPSLSEGSGEAIAFSQQQQQQSLYNASTVASASTASTDSSGLAERKRRPLPLVGDVNAPLFLW